MKITDKMRLDFLRKGPWQFYHGEAFQLYHGEYSFVRHSPRQAIDAAIREARRGKGRTAL